MTPDQLLAITLQLADLRIERDQAVANANALAAKNAELHHDIEQHQSRITELINDLGDGK